MKPFERIKALREDGDFTQNDIAKALQIHKNSYWNYENGLRDMPHTLIIKLAAFYQVSTDYLLGLTDDPKERWVKK